MTQKKNDTTGQPIEREGEHEQTMPLDAEAKKPGAQVHTDKDGLQRFLDDEDKVESSPS